MKLRSLVIAVLGMGVALAAPTAANAYASYTTGSVNQRTGPGVSYHRIGSLVRGSYVDVRYCVPGWCSVSSYLGPGWVSSRYLSGTRVYPRTYPRVYPYPYTYPYSYPYYGYPYRRYPSPGLNFYFRFP